MDMVLQAAAAMDSASTRLAGNVAPFRARSLCGRTCSDRRDFNVQFPSWYAREAWRFDRR
jgi:hypothetical protein